MTNISSRNLRDCELFFFKLLNEVLWSFNDGFISCYRDGNSKTSSDLLLKALLKETKDQKDMLQSVNAQISQLREENKVVNVIIRTRLENSRW